MFVSVMTIIRVARFSVLTYIDYNMIAVLCYLAIIFFVLLVLLILLARELAGHNQSLRRAEFLSNFDGVTTGDSRTLPAAGAPADPTPGSQEEGKAFANTENQQPPEERPPASVRASGQGLSRCFLL